MADDGAPGLELLREHAREFVAESLPILSGDHLFPRSRRNPFLRVGYDYAGSDVATPAHDALEQAIGATHERFSESTPLMDRQFASQYTYAFLEACITRLTLSDDPWFLHGAAVNESIEELVAAVTKSESEVACCQVVSNLTTSESSVLDVGDIRIVPVSAAPEGHQRELRDIIASVIPASGSAFRYGGDVHLWAPPESVVVARQISSDPFSAASEVSRRVSRFLLVAQLMSSGTARSMYEVKGGTSMVRRLDPQLMLYRGEVGLMSRTQSVRRTIVLSPRDVAPLRELDALLGNADAEREGLAVDSLAFAIHLFRRSFYAGSPFEQILDLMTALEAAMSDQQDRTSCYGCEQGVPRSSPSATMPLQRFSTTSVSSMTSGQRSSTVRN